MASVQIACLILWLQILIWRHYLTPFLFIFTCFFFLRFFLKRQEVQFIFALHFCHEIFIDKYCVHRKWASAISLIARWTTEIRVRLDSETSPTLKTLKNRKYALWTRRIEACWGLLRCFEHVEARQELLKRNASRMWTAFLLNAEGISNVAVAFAECFDKHRDFDVRTSLKASFLFRWLYVFVNEISAAFVILNGVCNDFRCCIRNCSFGSFNDLSEHKKPWERFFFIRIWWRRGWILSL